MAASTGAALLGLRWPICFMWRSRSCRSDWLQAPRLVFDRVQQVLRRRDLRRHHRLADSGASREFLWKFVDALIIDGTVNGVGRLVRGLRPRLRHMQTVRSHLCGWILFGGVLVVAWFLR